MNLNAQSSFKNTPKFSFSGRPEMKDKKKGMPGPGQYALTNTEKDKFSVSPKFGFGGGVRDDGRVWAQYPGPGQYKPGFDPRYNTPPRFGFGSEPRLHETKKMQAPGPGHYDIRGNLEGLTSSIASRPEGRPGGNGNPGPGQYKIDSGHALATASSPCISFGASSRAALVLSKTPGPGSYQPQAVNNKTPPKYSIAGRYNPAAMDITPGPSASASTFCK